MTVAATTETVHKNENCWESTLSLTETLTEYGEPLLSLAASVPVIVPVVWSIVRPGGRLSTE